MAMSKKNLVAVAFISILLVSTIVGVQFFNVAFGNYIPPPLSFWIDSPRSSIGFANYTKYNVGTIPLNAVIEGSASVPYSIFYELDGVYHSLGPYNNSSFIYNGTLNVEDGQHILQFTYSDGPHGSNYSCVVWFEVDTTPPQIDILRLENNPHNTTETWLSFYVNETISSMAYSLDGEPKVSIPTENKTLIGLPYGVHNMFFYANDSFGNMGISETLSLAIPSRLPFPTESPSPTPSPLSAVPSLSILSPVNDSVFGSVLVNNTFPDVNIPLIYTTNEELSWVGYSLDGTGNVTVSKNTTIVQDPTQGFTHNLTLYANDTLGEWAIPQTVYYYTAINLGPAPTLSTVPTIEPTPTPLPTINLGPQTDYGYAIVAVVVIVLIGIGIFAYAKRKRSRALNGKVVLA
jgi:hypothetical protein